METTVLGTLPLDTPAGNWLPKVSLTLSRRRPRCPGIAVKVKVLEVSVGPNVTLVAESE